MKKVDYIIVGDGYAGLFFAHQLIKHQKSFVLFSEGKESASHVSAGVINPAVLKRFTTFWLAQEQIDSLKNTLQEMAEYTHKNYLIDEPILRIFHDDSEKELWLKKAKEEKLKSFLSPELVHLEIGNTPKECGKVQQSSRLDVQQFFSDVLTYLDQNQYLIKESFDYQLLDIQHSRYKNIHFNQVIFAEGMGVKKNPYFCDIPVHQNKGHQLEVELSESIKTGYTLKKKHFLFPVKEGYYYGGTYDREQTHQKIDPHAEESLKKGLAELYPFPFKIKKVKFGFRPTVKDRRPIVGCHHQHKNLYVFNGLGARGILNGNYFAQELFDHIELQKPLPQEIEVYRF